MTKERIVILLPFLLLSIIVFRYIAPKSDAYRVIENNSFWKWKTFDDNTYDIILSGDSRIYRGVSPSAMNEVLKEKSIINFAYGSAGYSEVMFREINRRIDDNAKGRMIVLGVTPLTLTPEGGYNYHLNFELKTKREELLELKYFKPVLSFFVPYTLAQLERKTKGKEFYTSFHQEYIHGGWVATHEDKPWPESALKPYSTRFTNNQVSDKLLKGLLNQVNEWTKKGITVIALRPPTTKEMVALEDSLSGYNEQLIRKELELNGANWLDFNKNHYFSYDGSHLQKESAIRFSKDLAKKLRIISICPLQKKKGGF